MRGIKSFLLVGLLAVVSCSTQSAASNPQKQEMQASIPTNLVAQGMDAEAYYNRGYAKGVSGDTQGAIADYTEAIRLKPDYAKAYFYCGLAKLRRGNYQGAIADYTEAIQLKPNDAEAYFYRGSTKYYVEAYNTSWTKGKSGDTQGAIADYTEAIRLKPDYAEAYFLRGLSKALLGDIQGAQQDFLRARELGHTPK